MQENSNSFEISKTQADIIYNRMFAPGSDTIIKAKDGPLLIKKIKDWKITLSYKDAKVIILKIEVVNDQKINLMALKGSLFKDFVNPEMITFFIVHSTGLNKTIWTYPYFYGFAQKDINYVLGIKNKLIESYK